MIAIAVLLVAILVRRGRTTDWLIAAALVAFLFWGLFYSYSQSSFVALFVVTFAIAVAGSDRRTRVVLLTCALAATLVAAGVAGAAIGDRSARDVTSGRSRLVQITLDAFEERPIAGVGIGGQPRASADASGRRTTKRNASHTTPLTVLAELGVIGFAVFLWLLVAVGWALALVARSQRAFGIGLAAVGAALFVHSLLYAGFFEDPLTWGVCGLAAAAARAGRPARASRSTPAAAPAAPELLAH